MTIRKATYRELNMIRQHASKVMSESVAGHGKPAANNNHSLVSFVMNSGGYYLVDIYQSQLRGWIGVCKTMDNISEERQGFIPELYVLPTYRKQGIAENLLASALTELKRQGLKQVQLQVFVGNPAKKLYEKFGFTDTSTLMTKKLDE
ncbi:GNAT family N-acetyltransferase [Lentibacillus sp. L22]|uniref:GNAT family N-acetyltransferase n=1 Tax=Lentibacillus TaxID=175304 RepID=UPI0022B08CCB|nr:GNAT family N-acetyltransferase [Lentibacillus daqui]